MPEATTTTTTAAPIPAIPKNGALSIVTSGVTYQIRPAPLFSLDIKHNRNKISYLGATYDISLNGYIPEKLTYISGDSSSYNFDAGSPTPSGLHYILNAQSGLIDIFSKKRLDKLEISNVDSDAVILAFENLQVNSLNFEALPNFNLNKYTVGLTSYHCSSLGSGLDEPEILHPYETSGISMSGYNLEDFNESWNIDVNESYGFQSSGTPNNLSNPPRSYTASRTITATSRSVFNQKFDTVLPNNLDISNNKPAWENARDAIKYYLDQTSNPFHESGILGNLLLKVSGTNYPSYIGHNHSRTENTDKAAGSYTITDSWIIARSGDKALENYTMSINAGRDNPYVKIGINGTIKGLSQWAASGDYHNPSGANASNPTNGLSPYQNALEYYYDISRSGLYGLNSKILKRIQAAATHRINPQPLSISIGTNEFAGEITYSLDFDNRPLNFFSGVMSENISINDTYPGDVFATIPVLGRPTGPILQFTFGRTEYKRDISIEILLDYSDIGYNQDRAALILRKPSINDPIKTQLNELIALISPGQEPGIRKYFLANPPTESWNPKEGRYTLSLGWVYELSE